MLKRSTDDELQLEVKQLLLLLLLHASCELYATSYATDDSSVS